MNVVITAQAQDDLEQIADYIAADSPERALLFVRQIRQRCEALGDMPQAFPLVPRYEQQGVRRRVYENYLIFYRIGPDAVEILHVLHGARDVDALLIPFD